VRLWFRIWIRFPDHWLWSRETGWSSSVTISRTKCELLLNLTKEDIGQETVKVLLSKGLSACSKVTWLWTDHERLFFLPIWNDFILLDVFQTLPHFWKITHASNFFDVSDFRCTRESQNFSFLNILVLFNTVRKMFIESFDNQHC